METSGFVLLAVSCAISFGLGRTVIHFRDKKREKSRHEAQQRAAQALRDQPPEAESRNKSKRKRQLLQQEKKSIEPPL